ARGELSASLRARLLQPGAQDAVGRRRQLRRAGMRGRALLRRPQRALLARRISPGRPPSRCRACHRGFLGSARARGAGARGGPGRDRLVHLVLENDGNESRYLARTDDKRPLFQAQWNDDLHHGLHILLTGERDGYYADYHPPLAHVARALTEGFAFQGEWSTY